VRPMYLACKLTCTSRRLRRAMPSWSPNSADGAGESKTCPDARRSARLEGQRAGADGGLSRQASKRPSDKKFGKLLELHKEGLSYRLIGRNLGLSKNTVMQIVQREARAQAFVAFENPLWGSASWSALVGIKFTRDFMNRARNAAWLATGTTRRTASRSLLEP
jgi:hypothetical protein